MEISSKDSGGFETDNKFYRYVHHFKHKAHQTMHGIQDNAIKAINRGRRDDYSHIYRQKTLFEFALLSGAVCGIELCYSAETAFGSPILLSLGVRMRYMTLFWCLSPLFGFFITPLIGSLSDSCRSKLGRRRPFIILLSVGILLGLILVPNGRNIGIALGDHDYTINTTLSNETDSYNVTELHFDQKVNGERNRPWGIFFTVVGVVLLDCCCDACQAPARTFLLDVSLPKDHARGLSVFTILCGIGGSIGYAMGGIDWKNTYIGTALGSHEKPVFTFVTVIFVICVITTITSFKEMPLDVIYQTLPSNGGGNYGQYHKFSNDSPDDDDDSSKTNNLIHSYGSTDYKGDTLKMTSLESIPSQELEHSESVIGETIETNLFQTGPSNPSVKTFLKSILALPKSMLILCLTHLFCCMSIVSYSLYFTDFVGEVVFGGDPRLPETDPGFQKYQEGVRFGCWGMGCSLLSCAAYSYIIERLVKRFGAKLVYICSQLVQSAGMIIIATARHKAAVILMSPTTGILYATLFNIPYLLVAHYHETSTFAVDSRGQPITCTQVRGIGTDLAIIGSMIFLAQFILSSCMGNLVATVGSSVASVCSSAVLSSFGAISASKVLYLDL